ARAFRPRQAVYRRGDMSLLVVRRGFALALLIFSVPLSFSFALGCGGEQAGSVPPGAALAVPSAHPSPDPPPAVPLVLTREDAGRGDGAAPTEAGTAADRT